MSDPNLMLPFTNGSIATTKSEARAEKAPARSAENEGAAGQLTDRELFLLVAVSAVVFITTVSVLGSWRSLILSYGDNLAYAIVATAIRHWNFQNLDVQHFMGYPYLIAAISWLLHVPISAALWLVACAASLVAVFVTARLFGTWVAAYFALTNFAWLQLSFLGGSEPLAAALGLGSLLMFRRRRIFLAALLASLGVTVRPLTIFALVGIGLVLMYRKEVKAFLIAFGTGLFVGGLYVAPLMIYFGDPLLTVHSYTSRDYGSGATAGPHGHLFGWPFHGIVVGTMVYPAPLTNLALSFFWIFLVLAGTGMMFSRRFREHVKMYPNEGIYCCLYLVVLFCYDYLIWARGNFMRFTIPVLPFVLYALRGRLPKNRWFVWFLCVASSALAAISAIGVRNVIR